MQAPNKNRLESPKEGINVLSLFDGCSCGQVALQRAGIKVNNYFASEIDKHAISVTMSNFPNTIQIGDVTQVKVKTLCLSEVYKYLCSYDTNLQSYFSEWEMLYWLNQNFACTTKIGTQKPNERQEISKHSVVQCFEEIRFSNSSLGNYRKIPNNRGSGTSRDKKYKRTNPELQCSGWGYDFDMHPRDTQENLTITEGEAEIRTMQAKNFRNIKEKIFGQEESEYYCSENKRSDVETGNSKEVFRRAKENRFCEKVGEEESNGRNKAYSDVRNSCGHPQNRNENDGVTETYRYFLQLHKDTQITVVEFENGISVIKGKFHILQGGSPCQGFSFAGKQLNFDDPRSKLFFEFVRLLDEAKPRFFFLENVKMKKEFENIITETLLVEPIEINSNLVSAQNRKRLYWTNILGMEQPKDRGILMKDIVHEYNDELYAEDEYLIDPEKVLSGCEIRETEKDHVTTINPRFDNGKQTYQQQRVYETDGKFPAISAELNGRFNIVKLNEFIVPFDKTLRILDKEVQRGKVGFFRTDSQANRVYYIHDKAVTLTGESGDGAAKMGQYLFGAIRNITKRDFEISVSKEGKIRPHRKDEKKSGISEVGTINGLNSKANTLIASNNQYIHTFENDYLFGCITPDRVEKRQNGQRFNDGRKFYTLTAQDQHGILIEGYIRKLTPVECERLQTLPDNYSAAASKAQRYKMCGNGWTVDVIVEFFKLINITNTIQT